MAMFAEWGRIGLCHSRLPNTTVWNRHGLRHQLIAGAVFQQAARGGFAKSCWGLPVEALTTPPELVT
jgi:hypothetical protein